jgi:3D (Asp-Asp-Asp) domain-containing protein
MTIEREKRFCKKMKKVSLKTKLMRILLFLFIMISFSSREATPERIVLDVLTVYNPVPSQTDDAPLITASGARINLARLKSGEIRWMALSQDIIRSKTFVYGDTVLITANDPEIDGYWIVHDTMNRRYRNRGDLLFHQSSRNTGKWMNVTIKKISRTWKRNQ